MGDVLSRRFRRTILCIAICTLSAAYTMADENITVTGVSGELDRGGELIISGYGFGTKVPAAPRLWDDFEGHPIGQSVGTPVYGVYSRVGSSVYSTTDPYGGSGCSHSAITSTSDAPGLVSNWIPLEATDAFASMKFKLRSDYGSVSPHNVKLIRVNAHDPDPTHGYPNFNIGNDRGYTGFSGIVNHGLMGQVYFGSFDGLTGNNDWHSISIMDHLGDMDVANGFAGREFNGQYEERHDIVTLQSGHLSGLRSAFFCGYVSHDGYDADLYLDDVYADITLARVLVRSPDGGNFEMQIPQAWGSTQIRVLANPGRYPSGTQLQLIVYDAENHASAPYTVVVGQNDSGGGGNDDGPPGQSPPPVLQLVQ
ncbi:MAG: hypothetical protein R3D98_10180 [Candidatus Krumholzibacteriia bacterium]